MLQFANRDHDFSRILARTANNAVDSTSPGIKANPLKLRHIILGTVCWLITLTAGYLATRAALSDQSSSVSELTDSIGQWLGGARQSATAVSESPLYIALDDPIFVATADGRYVQAGHVSSVDGTRSRDPQPATEVQVVIYDSAISSCPDGFRLEYYTTPMSLDWVIKMMIPEERQQQIRELIQTEWEQHQHDVMQELQPVMAEAIRRATRAVEAELPAIMEAHRDEFRGLSNRFETEILRQELLPLVREEIFPIVQEEAEPLVRDIGRSLWDRVSLFSFTWRYLYDISPLPERDAVNTEFQRFIDSEAVPELESRSEEIIQVTQSVIDRVMRNERVRSTIRENTQRVAEDPELRQIVAQIIREATLENDRLHQDLRDYWNSRNTQNALKMATSRFEPVVRSIGDVIFGTRETGITPEFSRILRSQILKKDRRWFVMVPDETAVRSASVSMTYAWEPMLFPLEFAGQHQSPLTPTDSIEDDSEPSTDRLPDQPD